ncbi:MAG: hypothetical protein M3680_25605, partial [Myxococcota bacterium]|nr:hypothetical protein [Myxococcota bacterium]
MAFARRARDLAVESILAGGVIGAVEGLRVSSASDGSAPQTWAVVAALATVGATALAVVLHLVSRGIERIPVVARGLGDLAAGGERRGRAIVRVTCAVLGLLGFGIALFRIAAWVHERYRFNDAGPVGLLLAVAGCVVALVILVLAVVAERQLSARLARHPDLFDGRGVWVAIVLAVATGGFAPSVIVELAVP